MAVADACLKEMFFVYDIMYMDIQAKMLENLESTMFFFKYIYFFIDLLHSQFHFK